MSADASLWPVSNCSRTRALAGYAIRPSNGSLTHLSGTSPIQSPVLRRLSYSGPHVWMQGKVLTCGEDVVFSQDPQSDNGCIYVYTFGLTPWMCLRLASDYCAYLGTVPRKIKWQLPNGSTTNRNYEGSGQPCFRHGRVSGCRWGLPSARTPNPKRLPEP